MDKASSWFAANLDAAIDISLVPQRLDFTTWNFDAEDVIVISHAIHVQGPRSCWIRTFLCR